MNTQFLRGRLWLPIVAVLLSSSAVAQGGEDVEVQTSGPVHEGFATPTVFEESSEPYYVDVDPPTLIEEVTPQERPAGDTEWVPGYWSYEDETRQWMWISGTWRATPPGYVWVSGYWYRTWKGWRYVRGYWAPVGYGTGEIEYLPAPPPTLEGGPVGYAPWANAIWIPGSWIWVSGGYLGWMWQPGYWIVYSPDWTWVPASYAWTPYGYVYIPGHWDRSYEHLGLLYAPVCFPRHSYMTVGFSYSPSFVINVSVFSGCFFARPAYHHYYFGDYYAQSYWNRGIYPAFSFHYTKHGYDPIFAHASIQHGKGNPKWAEVQRSEYLVRRDDVTKRPARTLAQQNRGQGLQIAVASRDADEKATKLKLERVPDADKGKLLAHAKEMRQARQERVKVEAVAGSGGDKLPDNPRRVKSAGFVPGSVSAKAVRTAELEKAPKQPDIPKNLERPTAQPEGRKPGRKLRDPSLDLPVAGDKPKDVQPEREKEKPKPGDDGPGKKADDDVPARRPPFNKPGGDAPAKKPADDVPGKKADDDVPVRRPPTNKPGGEAPAKKPADDVPGKKADDDVPVRRPPTNKPGGEAPVKKPADEQPPAKKPGDSPPPRKPDVIRPPARKPDDVPPPKKPDEGQPSHKKPEDVQPPKRSTGKKPDEPPQPGKKPDDVRRPPPPQPPQPAPNDPRATPPKPGDRKLKPGEQPESKPVKKPGDKDKPKGGG
jgi:hypothetical protein